MIESINDIIKLLNEYIATQQECTYQFLLPEAVKWSVKKEVNYVNGIVLGRLREQDPLTLKVLKEGVTNQALYDEIRINIEHNIEILENIENPNAMRKKQLEYYKMQKGELSINSIDNWISKKCRCIQEDVDGRTYSEIRVLMYLYYSFDNYSYQKNSPYCSELNELKTVYENVMDKKSQFYKYGIISINNERELLPINPPRIYDRTINKTFFIKNVPLNLLKKISDMMSCDIVKDFSVRLFNTPGYNGRIKDESITETLERGEVFDFVSLGNYSISKLYSKEYEDCMWIVIDSQNITFEELCKDFKIYNNMIVTQVVHLQYETEGKCTYIIHLDHEYVFYTIDEYANRMNNVTQKGAAKMRMKSFKIDNSRIPFSYRCEVLKKDKMGNDLPYENEQFLCYVLECYFKHKDLLKEYFQKILC